MAVNGTDHFADLKKKYGTKPTTAAQPRETRSRSSAVTAAPKDYFAELKEKYPGSSAPTATQKAPGSGNKLSLAYDLLHPELRMQPDGKVPSSSIALSPIAKSYDDAVKTAQREAGYRRKYSGLAHAQLREAMDGLAPDTPEHTWLDNYINETMRPEDYDWELEKAGKDLQAAQEELHRLSTVGGADYFTQEEIARSTQLKKTIEQLTQKRRELESQKKYRFLSENPDFAEKSKPATASRKSNYFDVLLQTKDYQYDAVNGYLRNIQGEARENGNATMAYAIGAVYGNYAYISPEERAIYNYLYNTQGADSAGEYMDYIKNTLSERSQKYTLEEWEKLAKEMPVSTSIASVPMSLWGGIGYLGAVGEKVVRDISGDYMTPINYNSAAMMPGKMSSAIRKTVSQDLVDRYGVIRLNEEKYPTLSKLLNGKSWADVYQLGMGMVDSTAVALMSPVLGPHGTLLLAGNAATQTMLTAVENGASDDQALMLGALSGSFEYLFEKYELESLLGKSDDVLRKLFTQALSEGFGEGMTSIANLAADTLVMADKSELSRLAAEYMKNDPGMSEEAAMKKALADLAIQVGWDTVGGMFTGGIMGGGKAVIDTLSARTQQPQSTPQPPVAPQAENGQATQETAAEPTSGSLEWVQELNELGTETEATQQPASKEQMLQEVIGEVLGLNTSASADVGAVEQTQKNTTQTSGNKYHLRGYSQQQKDNWKSSKRIVLYEGIEQFKNFIKNALSGKIQTNKKLYFGAVDSDLASAISTETGVNVEGYNLALGENEIRKINKDHGNEQTEAPRGQRAVTEADYLGIPDVVQSPDSIKLSSKLYEGKPVIEFRKTNGNETTVVSAVVSDKRLDLFVQTTYVNKKRGSIATPESEQADSNTPEATGGTAPDKDVTQSPAEGQTTNHGTNAQSAIVSPSSNNSIPQTVPGVNPDSASPAVEPGPYEKTMALLALGLGKDSAQTVDTQNQTVYDDINNQGGVVNDTREESRESFYRRANEEVRTVRERGKIACGYNPVADKTGRAGQTEDALRELGIPVIIHDGLEVNVNSTTITTHGDATSVAGDCVYVRNTLEADPVETAGHEAYHFWKHTVARSAYTDAIIDNIDFSSTGFAQFQKEIAEAYFGKEVGIEDDGADKLTEEIFAYITGLVYAGDPNGRVHQFLRDYDAVKAAWDTLVGKQRQGQSAAQTDGNTSPPPVAPTDSMGAAPSGFDPNSHLQYQYGTLPEGKNAVRTDDLPVSTDGVNRVSQTAVTVKGAKVTSDEFADLMTKDVTEKNGMTYIPITNNATVQKAIDFISEEGWEDALDEWRADVRSGKAGADMSAMGALLLNNAAKAGDKAAWLKILHDYQLLGTNTAQGLQALQILKKLSPSDKLYMAKRSVKQMVRDMKLDADITIDPELEAEYNAAETDEQRDAVLKKIQKAIARQLPTTFMEKFTALRYLNMLGNLRTQARNVGGNLTMMGTRAIHNAVATGIERIANWVSHGKIGRTRSVIVNKEQMAAGKKDFDSLQDHILDGGKFNDNMTATGFARGVQEQKRIFAFKPLEGYRKVTNWMMEQGDIIFARQAYARALAGYLKANGVTEADFSKVDPAIMDDARLFAAKEAQEATFRDTNWLSGWVSKIGRRPDTPTGVKILSEGVMPFRKTPANVLVRAEEYSPLGIVNSVVLSVQAAKNGSDVTANQVINSWAKTLTGTGLFGMGILLQCLGLLSAGPDEDEQKDGFEDLNGWQNYALTLPDGTNLTIDCLSPSAIPVLMGAQLMQQIGEGGFQLKDLEKALTSIADPLVEMSMLQGVNALLENIQYADSNLGQFAINAATSYLTQVLTNTLAGQLERSFEDSRQQTYVDKDSQLPAWLQRTLGKASAKIPGLDYNQIPYINAWGEEEENPPAGLNLIYNLLSPSYIGKGIDNALTRELNRLNDVQSDVNVYPATPDKTVTIKKQVYHLSADEYVQLAKLQGQTQKQIVEDLIANSDYASLSDEDKAKAIREAYDYARDYARGEVVKDHPGITTKWMKEIGDDIAEGIIRHITADGKYTSLSVSDASYVDDLLAGLVAEKGKTNVRDIQRIEAIADSELSEKDQKAVLKDTLDDGAYEKYLRILATGVDTDDYALSYRLYLDAEGGTGKKERIISSFQRELDVSRRVAEKLYDIYSGKK